MALFATLAIILLVNPVGFIGGGWDDWQYLNAARCWVENGPCLPRDHWQGRWPIVAPLAASIALLGESRWSVGLPSFIYAMGCIALVARLGNRIAGPPVGWIAALLLLVMPMFAVELLDPNVEHPELFFLLASATFVIEYRDRPSFGLAFGAGLAWSLAFQVRETAIVAMPLLALAAWRYARKDIRALIAATLGVAAPILAELFVYYIVADDPLWRRDLSVAHARVPTDELLGPIDYQRPPFFNVNYIANWKQEPGIYIHWTVDGLLNLVTNAFAGLTIPLGIILLAFYWKVLSSTEKSFAVTMMVGALYWASSLIFGLAVDPSARMMLVPAVMSIIAVAVILHNPDQVRSKAVARVSFVACWLSGISILAVHQEIRSSENRVEAWLEGHTGQLEADLNTRRHLALVRGASDISDVSAERPYLVIKLDMKCRQWADRYLSGQLEVMDASNLSLSSIFKVGLGGQVCLFKYRRALDKDAVIEAKRRALLSGGRSIL